MANCTQIDDDGSMCFKVADNPGYIKFYSSGCGLDATPSMVLHIDDAKALSKALAEWVADYEERYYRGFEIPDERFDNTYERAAWKMGVDAVLDRNKAKGSQ